MYLKKLKNRTTEYGIHRSHISIIDKEFYYPMSGQIYLKIKYMNTNIKNNYIL